MVPGAITPVLRAASLSWSSRPGEAGLALTDQGSDWRWAAGDTQSAQGPGKRRKKLEGQVSGKLGALRLQIFFPLF